MKHSSGSAMSLAAVLFTTGCSSSLQTSPETPLDAPRTPLVPQSENTPLPLRDPRIADHWPPELKRVIDDMLALYSVKEKPSSPEEIEQRMGVRLMDHPWLGKERDVYKAYRVVGGRRANLDSRSWNDGWVANYVIYRARPPSRMTQAFNLTIPVSPKDFCLNPYELAIYTGSKFIVGDRSPALTFQHPQPAYVWGMFEWSTANHYIGNGFHVFTDRMGHPGHRRMGNPGCIGKIGVLGDYVSEPRRHWSDASIAGSDRYFIF